ncbi:response regulator [Sporomusa sphaeroides]
MIRAIIADDEQAVASIICHFIEKEYIPIKIVGMATDGRQAVKLIREQQPDLVFLDIQMPFMNGFEVMQTVADTHFIIITAYESFQYAQQALRLGACDIILKPIEYKQFIQAITRAIGWKFTSNKAVNEIPGVPPSKLHKKNFSVTVSNHVLYNTQSYGQIVQELHGDKHHYLCTPTAHQRSKTAAHRTALQCKRNGRADRL